MVVAVFSIFIAGIFQGAAAAGVESRFFVSDGSVYASCSEDECCSDDNAHNYVLHCVAHFFLKAFFIMVLSLAGVRSAG